MVLCAKRRRELREVRGVQGRLRERLAELREVRERLREMRERLDITGMTIGERVCRWENKGAPMILFPKQRSPYTRGEGSY